MIVVKREDVDKLIEAATQVATRATNARGLRIMWRIDSKQAEKVLLAAMAILGPTNNPECVLPEDVKFVDTDEDGKWYTYP